VEIPLMEDRLLNKNAKVSLEIFLSSQNFGLEML